MNEYMTIGELNHYIKEMFDADLMLRKVHIKGEISNFKAHTRGHYYFTLKDDTSRISAIMFSYYTKSIKFIPMDGMKVLVTGKINVYEANGNYQIYVEEMIEDGVGNLYVAFEQLKERLGKEGLFNKEHKKPIRRIPKKIGIITASTGAAIRDILTTIKRRYPVCETILFPALVQGNNASEDIVKKIELANTFDDLDTLIVGRGGGSIEDLWPFNEEVVARAIYNSRIPIISAVGHEIDFTIADFVADLRAPTPTAAAELAVPDINTIITYLNTSKTRSYNAIINIMDNKRQYLNKLRDSYVLKKPLSIYEIKEQKLDTLIDRLDKDIMIVVDNYKVRLAKCRSNYLLNNPSMLYKFQKQHLDNQINKLEVLNPLNTLKRGYAIIRKDDKVTSSINKIKKGDMLTINLNDGNIETEVVRIGEKNE